ncbi:MAG: sulfatase-like hydrolase/transferase, partial [Anaerolineae bacterium]|nr:sulfatase-like hydrolase/transferase [Anaerolineae bacterium]
VYLSDHGDMMGDHWLQQKGPFHFQGLIRVPYIWSWPGHIAAGKVHTGIASILDLAPTILDFCGVPIPEGPRPVEPIVPREGPPWPGHSLKPILEGSGDTVRNSALVDQDDDFAGLRARTLVTERYRITCYAGQPYGELFDLREDPQELHNLWDDPGYRLLRYELAVQLLDEVGLHESRFPRRLAGA